MHYHISKNDLSDFDKNIRREWVLTNGLGGYACLRPPVSRYVVFSKSR